MCRGVVMDGWQPIETAPKGEFDKSRWYLPTFRCLAVVGGNYIDIVDYGYTEKGRGRWLNSSNRVCEPTHWMLLPALPSPTPNTEE